MNTNTGEKSDEGIVPVKRPNKGGSPSAEDVEGRAQPKGNSRQSAAVRTQRRTAASIRVAVVRRAMRAFNVLIMRCLT